MRRLLHPARASTIAGALAVFLAAGPAAGAATAVLDAVVGLKAVVPPGARTAAALGTERAGSGVVIDDRGLILTIGYLILEASAVSVTARDGSSYRARIVAYDHVTGFGLVRAARPLPVDPAQFGDSAALDVGASVLAVSSGSEDGARPARVVDRREFAGYWEYLLEGAIFVSPPHPFFGGSALVSEGGRLVGVGSLFVGDAVQGDDPLPGNMFIPIDALKPILEFLVATGRGPGPRRPWIGVYSEEYRGNVVVTRVAEGGPAQVADMRPNDVILRVAGTPVLGLAAFYRAMWDLGEAGVAVPLSVLRGSEVIDIAIRSMDRYLWLKLATGRVARGWFEPNMALASVVECPATSTKEVLACP